MSACVLGAAMRKNLLKGEIIGANSALGVSLFMN